MYKLLTVLNILRLRIRHTVLWYSIPTADNLIGLIGIVLVFGIDRISSLVPADASYASWKECWKELRGGNHCVNYSNSSIV